MQTNAEIAESLPGLVSDMKRYKRESVLLILSGLLCDINYHANTIRIETLINLAVIYCNGNKVPHRKKIDQWFQKYLDTTFVRQMEDPVEDVFISHVTTQHGDFRIFEGIWESGVFWLQCVLDTLRQTPDIEPYISINKSILSLLRLSEA